MPSGIRKIKLGTLPALMPGDLVTRVDSAEIWGYAVAVDKGVVTVRPIGNRDRMITAIIRRDVRLVRRIDRLPSEPGCSVKIHNGSHSGPGTLERTDGSYNYVHAGSPGSGQVLELYPCEFTVEAVYRHPDYIPGSVVRFVDHNKVDFKEQKPCTHGVVRGVAESQIVVQPFSSPNIVFLKEDEIVLEKNGLREALDVREIDEFNLPKLAVRALLVTCKSLSMQQLCGLLATQGYRDDHVRTIVYELVNERKAQLSRDQQVVYSSENDECVDGTIRDSLFASTDAVRKARLALAEAVFQTIANTGGRLPRR